VRWLYETTQPLLEPFAGIFPSPSISGGFVIEFTAIFAIMIYAFIGYLATAALEAVVFYGKRRHSE